MHLKTLTSGKVTIDLDNSTVTVDEGEGKKTFPMDSPEAFAITSDAWLRVGWDTKHIYGFTWFGRPVIQLPDDMIRIQELIYTIKPDVIIECGVAHGGGLIYYSSILKAIGKGRLIGVEVELRPHNRKALEEHQFFDMMTIVDGSTIEPVIVDKVRELIAPDETVLVFLDSNHSKDHVLAELHAYAPMVSVGSYIVAMDGIMNRLEGAPRSKPDWSTNNPKNAAEEFVKESDNFVLNSPDRLFNEGTVEDHVTYWPNAFIKRIN